MRVKDLLDMKVSLYKRVSENKSCMTITLNDWLHKVSPAARDAINNIREVNMENAPAAKAMKLMNLPCVTISAVFEGERKTELVTELNPIICIDIDDMPDGYGSWEDVKEKVFGLPYVFYVSLSARGEGVFALACYDKRNAILDTFRALEKDFKDMGIVIDKNCKDITRLRFVSYDDVALEKDGEVEVYDKIYEEKKEPVVYQKRGYSELDSDSFAMKTVYYLIDHCCYTADSYEDWLLDGFRLASLGERGYYLFMYLSQRSDGWNEREANAKWRECMNHTKMDRQCLAHYFRVAKERLGVDWRDIIRNS